MGQMCSRTGNRPGIHKPAPWKPDAEEGSASWPPEEHVHMFDVTTAGSRLPRVTLCGCDADKYEEKFK